MQGQNNRYMMQSKEQHVEERKQILVEERAKKQEEKAQKELAAEERRKAAENKRILRLKENEEKRAKSAQKAMEKRKTAKQKREDKDKEEADSLTDLPPGQYSLSSLVVRQQWPESTPLKEPVFCTRCSETLTTKLDCFTHILDEEHLSKAEITLGNFTQDKLVNLGTVPEQIKF